MTGTQRGSLKNRVLKAPLLVFPIDKKIDQLKNETEWINLDRNAVTLQKNSKLRVVLITMHKGAALHEHTIEGPLTLFVVTGKIKFKFNKEAVKVESNGLIVLEKSNSHDIEALKDTTFILTIINP